MSKFFLVPFIFLSFFTFSCSTFVNLGDTETGSKNGDSLPEELSDNENYEEDSNESGDTGNTGDSTDTGDSMGDTGDTGNTGNTGIEGSDENVSDQDNYATDDEDNSSYNGEYPFDDGFASQDCSCGDDPIYEPTCCDGSISVFNSCFANCYNIHSDSEICVETAPGVCDKIETPDSEINDTEISDEDAVIIDNDTVNDGTDTDEIPDTETTDDTDIVEIINNECGCYPNDTNLYCCYVNGTVLVSKCMAECMCAGGYSNCY